MAVSDTEQVTDILIMRRFQVNVSMFTTISGPFWHIKGRATIELQHNKQETDTQMDTQATGL